MVEYGRTAAHSLNTQRLAVKSDANLSLLEDTPQSETVVRSDGVSTPCPLQAVRWWPAVQPDVLVPATRLIWSGTVAMSTVEAAGLSPPD